MIVVNVVENFSLFSVIRYMCYKRQICVNAEMSETRYQKLGDSFIMTTTPSHLTLTRPTHLIPHTLTHHILTGEVSVSMQREYNGCEL